MFGQTARIMNIICFKYQAKLLALKLSSSVSRRTKVKVMIKVQGQNSKTVHVEVAKTSKEPSGTAKPGTRWDQMSGLYPFPPTHVSSVPYPAIIIIYKKLSRTL
jgi:hypothetical protein